MWSFWLLIERGFFVATPPYLTYAVDKRQSPGLSRPWIEISMTGWLSATWTG